VLDDGSHGLSEVPDPVCSYCGCRAIDVIGRFSAEHEQIVNACGDLRRAVSAREAQVVREAAGALADLLHPHTGAEEKGLFAELRTIEEFTAHVDELCGEHIDLDARLASIAGGVPTPAEMDAFETALRRHIDKEENGLFPAAAVELDGPAWVRVHELTPAPR
jgi:hemerythrin-like domain-containing protein